MQLKNDSIPFRVDTIASVVHINKTFVENPAWVHYPVLFENHRENSKDYVKHYSKKEREYIIAMFKKAKKYFPRSTEILKKYDLPQELQMLIILESNFNANAVSAAGAVGYWQFMSELGREYGLTINSRQDDRKNFIKSTTAAARYFRDQLDLYDNDLLLAVASYNCGTGRVQSAMKKSNKANPGFWDIRSYLPLETRLFVMRFISLNVVAANYDKFLNRKLNFREPPFVQVAELTPAVQNHSETRNTL